MNNMSLAKKLSIGLLISLGINLFVVGVMIGQHIKDQKRMTRLSFDNQISKLVEPLPRNGRREFYVTMKSKRDELIPIYQNIMQQRAAIMAIIAEEQFDTEKLRGAMQEYHKTYDNMVTPAQDVMISIIGDLSLEERQAVLERFNNPPRRDRRSRGSDRRRSSDDSSRRSNDDNDRNSDNDNNQPRDNDS